MMLLSKFISSRRIIPYRNVAWAPFTAWTAERSIFSTPHNAAPITLNEGSHQPFFYGKGNYQSLRLASFSTRRRRRRGGDTLSTPDDSSSENAPADGSAGSSSAGHSAALSTTEQFLSASKTLLDKIEAAVSELKGCNEGLEITRYPPSSTESIEYGTSDSSDEDENGDQKYQQHAGQLSIQVESSGDLYWGGGTYWITIHTGGGDALSGNGSKGGSGGFITLQSPLSGTFTYIYNASTGEWVANEDGHSLLGMFTRDWIRQCQGVPDF